MKKVQKQNVKEEFKNVIRNSFDEMLKDVMKGKKSIDEFRKVLDYRYAQKKMELSGSLF